MPQKYVFLQLFLNMSFNFNLGQLANCPIVRPNNHLGHDNDNDDDDGECNFAK